MKFLIKTVAFIVVVLLYTQADAQIRDGWSFGGGVGYMNYYGDLTPTIKDELKRHYKIAPNDRDLSYALFLERRLGPRTGLMINYNWGTVSANDLNIVGDSLSGPNRSLNFKTEIKDLSASYVFKLNEIGNGRLPISPYFYVGLGVTDFTVYGDLKDRQENRYNYSADTIVQDGIYETELSALNIEKDYKQRIWNIPFGVGLRFNTGKNWSVHLQTDVKYMFTDYLDDVSDNLIPSSYENEFQQYAAVPNPAYNSEVRGKVDGVNNDMYAFTTVSLRYNLGKSLKKSKKSSKVKRVNVGSKSSRSKNSGFVPPVFPPSPVKVSNTNSGENKVVENAVSDVSGENQDGNMQPDDFEMPDIMEDDESESNSDKKDKKGKKNKKDKKSSNKKDDKNDDQGIGEIPVVEEIKDAVAPVLNGNNSSDQSNQTAQPNQSNQSAAPQNQGGTAPAAYPSQTGGYDPVVEMYKIETDRLRSENSDLKNEKQFDALEGQIEALKQIILQNQQPMQQQQYQQNQNQPMQQQQYQQNQNQNQPMQQQYQQNQNQPMQQQQYQQNQNQPMQQQQNQQNQNQPMQQQQYQPNQNQPMQQQQNQQNQNQPMQQNQQQYQQNQQGSSGWNQGNTSTYENQNNNEAEEEEEKGFFKRLFNKNDSAEADEEKKGKGLFGLFGLFNGNDSVKVEAYQFKFIGDDINVNGQLRNQLRKIAKKANKGGQLVFEAETTEEKEAKTNTIVVQLTQILIEDYDVDASQITYDIKTIENEFADQDSQAVLLKVIY